MTSIQDTPALLDSWIRRWQFRERHSVETDASFVSIRNAIREISVSEIPLVRFLVWLRQPFAKRTRNRKPILEAAMDQQFLILEDTPSELVMGLAGRFWTPSGGRVTLTNPAAFAAFDRSGFAKAAVNFRILPIGGNRYSISTETRIVTFGRGATMQFGLYWWLAVRWGSGWIRLLWLRAIRDRAERDALLRDAV